MIESKKKFVEIAVIVLGILVLAFRFLQISITKTADKDEIVVEVPADFNLDDAKKSLSEIGGIKKKAVQLEKQLRDIFQKPEELKILEEKAMRGEGGPKMESPPEETLTLEGILFGGEKGNIAIISGKVVTEGEDLGGARVQRIERDRVLILRNGSVEELKR